jgi:hypothetical protein
MEFSEKDLAIPALPSLADGATVDDAIERLCFIANINEGLRQADAGQLVAHEEVTQQFREGQGLHAAGSRRPGGNLRLVDQSVGTT